MAVSNERPPTGYTGAPGTNKKMGLVRLATPAEATAGIANNLAVTPVGVKSAITAANVLNFATPPVAGFGSTTPRPVASTTLTSTSTTTLASNASAAFKAGNTTGTIGFFGANGTVRSIQAALTNSVTAGGTTGTIADFAGTTYATDGPIIRNDIYQLSLALANVITALRNYGLLA